MGENKQSEQVFNKLSKIVTTIEVIERITHIDIFIVIQGSTKNVFFLEKITSNDGHTLSNNPDLKCEPKLHFQRYDSVCLNYRRIVINLSMTSESI